MPFVPKKQAYNAKIHEVELGVGEKAVKLGGQNVLPFHTFDAEIANAPKIGVELTDLGMAEYTMPGEQAFYEGCQTVVDMAKRAETMEGASFLCLHFEGADPNGLNKSVEECVQLAKDVADAVTMPIVIMGCKNVEKDTELFNKCAEALAGKNILVLSARDENYKTVGASAGLAYNQKVGAESAVDINLAKQLNTVMTQLGVNPQSIIMNIGSAAAGYGYEYVASTLDRIRDAALKAMREAYPGLKGMLFPFRVPVAVRIDAYGPLPESRPKSITSEPYTFKPDADNIAKLVLDGMNGAVWGDDNQVVELHVVKWPRMRGIEPHMDIRVYRGWFAGTREKKRNGD